MNTIYFHADDYGITASQTEDILHCHTNGSLNSVSVLPNTTYIEEGLQLLSQTTIRKVVHLNFIEGPCVASPEQVSSLVNSDHKFVSSFGFFLKKSFLTGKARNTLKEQIKKEILAQITAVYKEEKTICIDSHQHLHMIPIVLESLLEVVKEQQYQIKELRIPVDPITPLLFSPSVWKRVRPVDIVKWLVLKICYLADSRLLKSVSFESPCFFGIFFTCRMELEIVQFLLKKYQRFAQKKHKKLELMFHPGGIYSINDLLDATQADLIDFYQSPYRKKEASTLMNIKKYS